MLPKDMNSLSTAASSGDYYEGVIQSFSEHAGWGFISCPSLGLSDGRGIFVHVKDCGGMSGITPYKGAQVHFTVSFGPSGKPQANNVSLCSGHSAASGAHTMNFGSGA